MWATFWIGKSFGLDDAPGHQVGERHFGGRREVVRRVVAGDELVVGELRELPGCVQGLRVEQHRHDGFFIAVRARVQVEHKLGECAVQPGEIAVHHHKTRTGHVGGHFIVHHSELVAEVDVIERLEVKFLRRTPAPGFFIVVFILAQRHAVIRQVGYFTQQLVQLRLHAGQRRLAGFQALPQRGHRVEQRLRVLPFSFGGADCFGYPVAFGLEGFGFALELLSGAFKRIEARNIEIVMTGFQHLGGVGLVLSQSPRVEHCLPHTGLKYAD